MTLAEGERIVAVERLAESRSHRRRRGSIMPPPNGDSMPPPPSELN